MPCPPTRGASPVRARLEGLMAPVAVVTYRTCAGAPLQRAVSPPPPNVVGILRDLGWLPDIRRLLAASARVTVPS